MGGACSQAVVEAGAFFSDIFARRRGRFAHDQMKLDLLMQNRSVIGQHFDQVPACTGPDFICWHVDGCQAWLQMPAPFEIIKTNH